MRRALQALVDAMLVFAVIALAPFAWLMRDGLGPDAVESSGTQALSRCFMTFYSGPILIGLIALALLFRHAGKRKPAEPVEE